MMKADVQDKKEAIIKAAFKLFTERGFHGTPTSMISEEAGVATGTLFLYFPTKEALINAAYLVAKNHMAADLKVGLDTEPTFKDKARRLWRNMVRWGLQNPEEFHFLEQFASSPFITKLTEKEVYSNFRFLADVLAEGIREGAIKDIKDMFVAEMIASSNMAVIKKILRDGPNDETEELIDRSFDLLWRGIGKS
jgi:AcrR family transcriptional regulator